MSIETGGMGPIHDTRFTPVPAELRGPVVGDPFMLDSPDELQPPAENKDKDDRDKEIRRNLDSLFPNLEGESNERGKAVKEALAIILESEKLTLHDLRELIVGGFDFFDSPEELPDAYQETDTIEKQRYLAGAQNGKIYLWPDFFETKYTDGDRARVIGHEIGHLISGRLVIRKDEQGNKQHEHMIDHAAYNNFVSTRPPEWNAMYVQVQVRKNAPHAREEMLADDIAIYSLSMDPQDWAMRRLEYLSQETQDQLKGELAARQRNPGVATPYLDDFIAHAEGVWQLLNQSLAKDHEYVQADNLGDGFGYDSPARPDYSVTTQGYIDSDFMKRFFDKLFGVKPL